MRNIALAAIPSMYLIGAGSLALADDAMKNELGGNEGSNEGRREGRARENEG